jgi:hypothetical protein
MYSAKKFISYFKEELIFQRVSRLSSINFQTMIENLASLLLQYLMAAVSK